MPSPGVPLWNYTTNSQELVPAEHVKDALASGKYASGDQSVVRTVDNQGAVATLPPQEGAGSLAAGAPYDTGATAQAQAGTQAKRDSFDTVGDKVASAASGFVDALWLGVPSVFEDERGRTRNDVNSGSHGVGEFTGTVASAGMGALKPVVGVGEGIGKVAAKQVIKQAESRIARAGERAIVEGATGAVIGTVSSTVHQAADSIVNDHPFAAEAVAHEAGVNALLGTGLGAVGGILSKGGSRASVKAQGGLLDPKSEASIAVSREVDNAIGKYDQLVAKYRDQVAIGNAIVDEGRVPELSPGMQKGRSQALKEAVDAQKALQALDREKALTPSGNNHNKMVEWQNAYDTYQLKAEALDKAMNLTPGEMRNGLDGLEPQVAGARPVQKSPGMPGEEDVYTTLAQEGDVAMASNPEAQARYKEINGRDWAPNEAGVKMHEEISAQRSAANSEGVDGANQEKVNTPSSQEGTNPGRKVAKGTPVESPSYSRIRQLAEEDRVNNPYPNPDALPITPAENGRAFEQMLDTPRSAAPVEVAGNKTIKDALPEGAAQGAIAKDAKLSAKAAGKAGTVVDEAPPVHDKTEVMDTPPAEDRVAALKASKSQQDYMDAWARESMNRPKVTHGDEAAANLDRVIGNIQGIAGTKLDSAGGLNPQELLGLPRSATSLGEKMQQLYTMRHMANVMADVSRGVKVTPSLFGKASLYAKRKMAGTLGAKMLAAVAGGFLGGPVGFMIGSSLVENGSATVGKIASSAGKLAAKVADAGTKMLSNNKGVAIAHAITTNTAHAYDAAGPIKDPVERFQRVQELARNPEALHDKIMNNLGDLVYVAPEVAQGIADAGVRRVVSISMRAPTFVFDRLGRTVMPAASKMRQAIEYENAANDLPSILDAVGNGTATQCQVDALKDCYPETHMKLATQAIQNKDQLSNMSLDKVRVVERILGTRVTSMADPMSVMRHQVNWLQANEAQASAVASQGDSQPPNGVNGKPQAFKMSTAPTPSQSAGTTGRAPGN